MQNYEVEVKSLLGSAEAAETVRAKLKELDPACECLSRNKQRNHYFIGGDITNLAEVVRDELTPEAAAKLDELAGRAMEYSVRTRDKDGQVLLVVKASVGADSSSNGIARIEFEEYVQKTLEELDALVLSAGFTYQAKWSREREEYRIGDMNITLDKNAGYGWLAEFEKVVDDPGKLDAAKADIKAFMEKVGVAELPQDRLERMFTYYNTHWQDYYGTDKIFTIE
jgi:adenylate cyclase class IV